MKNEVNKLSIVEKMAKVADMNNLQKQVTKLQTQQEKRTDKVAELQVEAKKDTSIIRPIHEKV